ncbi:RNA polymerase sigma-70 factor, ECF subfamily [Pedobacter westerhofensis]|uniref:RNA polymerase sigma-70 factor, ECF subfamily n=1 Tax=Pedobacter westerhofensis TaxID=425512 RepID=A0A521B6B6_9SPHI|nr:sigma-70 family RNA polymerase sigma factor [Pedobacter westerhofensis]SMO42606.1 RNA polymerase sigma-70 factor, ECF subfamily [Pedobacter westerhofensis]
MTDFDDIYNRYAPQIYRICMGYTNNSEQAKDLVQETFIGIWKGLPAFRQQSHIGTWIFRIATNNCLRAMEVARRMPQSDLPFDLAEQREESPEEKLVFLYRCIGELEETDRIIISLVLEDLPQAQIAEIIGLSNVNVRVKVHRIKEKLAKKFKAYGQFN